MVSRLGISTGAWVVPQTVCTDHPASALRGYGETMAYKVRKYEKAEDYLTPGIQGQVLISRDTWDAAVEWRDHFRHHNPDTYYNITHSTAVAVIDSDVDISRGEHDAK